MRFEHGVPVSEDANVGNTCRIIVCADDFGMSTDVNLAIVAAFERRLISRTSIMVNMPGFLAACDLADRHGLQGRVGLHLNLTEGWPLTAPIRRNPRFCEANGGLRPRRALAVLSRAERTAVEHELQAQIEAAVRAGLTPTHLDSHHHVHTEWPIGAIVMRLAVRYGIRSVRLTRNCGPRLGTLRAAYRVLYNRRLRAAGLAGTTNFGSVDDVVTLSARRGRVCEASVHPGLDAGRLVDRRTGEALESVVRRLREVGEIELDSQTGSGAGTWRAG